jgi:aspartate racemase
MAQHIGIVGCSAEGAALCYRTICAEGAAALGGAHRHPEVSLHTHSLHRYVERLDAGDLQDVADLMLDSARKLARCGADFLVCPDNTIHQAFALVRDRSPLPWLHIAEVVAEEALRRGFRKIGITGTHWLVGSEVYPERLRAHGLEFARPAEAQRVEMGRLIMDELVCGIQTRSQVDYLRGVIEGLKAQGCDAVVLGCTELPLILDDGNSPLPTLDSTRLLARAALRRAVATSS